MAKRNLRRPIRPAADLSCIFALDVTDDSMKRSGLTLGSTVHIHATQRSRPGDFVAVARKSGEVLFRRAIRLGKSRVELEQTDPPGKISIPTTDLKGLYRIVGVAYR